MTLILILLVPRPVSGGPIWRSCIVASVGHIQDSTGRYPMETANVLTYDPDNSDETERVEAWAVNPHALLSRTHVKLIPGVRFQCYRSMTNSFIGDLLVIRYTNDKGKLKSESYSIFRPLNVWDLAQELEALQARQKQEGGR